jgi:hypothetical protein
LPKTPFLSRRGKLSRLEVERAIYTASERISSSIIASALPEFAPAGTLDLWELENIIMQILTEAVNSVMEVDPILGEDLSFEIRRRRSALIDDMVSLFLECVRDAFGSSVEIDYPTPRTISVRLSKAVGKRDFIQKEFKSTIYEMLRYLIGK